DFNNDGLPDIYFVGNMVPNKLYLNKGDFRFEDITAIADVNGKGRWGRGAAVIDINNDGLPDIYVCNSFANEPQKRQNLLYINQGVN
ncbi:FG-GAP repeat domain-containing protein, partial [Rhizobium ruizarguesonis]